MNGAPGTNWGARRAEKFPHLGNYTLTTDHRHVQTRLNAIKQKPSLGFFYVTGPGNGSGLSYCSRDHTGQPVPDQTVRPE